MQSKSLQLMELEKCLAQAIYFMWHDYENENFQEGMYGQLTACFLMDESEALWEGMNLDERLVHHRRCYIGTGGRYAEV
jgi:hypothetical protein